MAKKTYEHIVTLTLRQQRQLFEIKRKNEDTIADVILRIIQVHFNGDFDTEDGWREPKLKWLVWVHKENPHHTVVAQKVGTWKRKRADYRLLSDHYHKYEAEDAQMQYLSQFD